MSPTPPSQDLVPSNQGRVLIVDDESELASALAEMLTKQGYETKGYGNGQPALDRISIPREKGDRLERSSLRCIAGL